MARMAPPRHPHDPANLDWFPLDSADHAAQLAGVRTRLGPRSRVLDLGAGDGRITAPLTGDGHCLIAVDCDPDALRRLSTLDPPPHVIEGDFTAAQTLAPIEPGSLDAALCLGHTFMLVHDPVAAISLLRTLRSLVRPGGWFAIDAFIAPLWNDVANGNWQTGISPDGASQLIWLDGDNTLVLRHGAAVDDQCWSVRESDTRYRLWSMGELTLLASASGWDGPRVQPHDHLIILTRPV